MSLAQLALLGFALWTIGVPLGAVAYYRCSRVLAGKAAMNAFPADALTGPDWYRRAMRAHANCVENLPVFGSIVVIDSLVGTRGAVADALALTVLLARMAQSTVHMGWVESARAVSVRFSFYLLQVLCMVALAIRLVASAGLRL